MRYLVMECHLSYAVVLDENGRFLKVANKNYETGAFVTDVIPMAEPKQSPSGSAEIYRRSLTGIAAMAACLLLALTTLLYGGGVYGSVYLRINPSVRIDVDRRDRVVGLMGQNEDGGLLVAEYEYHKKPLDTVTEELVDKAMEMNYLSAGGKVTVTVDGRSDDWEADTGNHLKRHLEETHREVSIVVEQPAQTTEAGGTPKTQETGYGPDQYQTSDYRNDAQVPPDHSVGESVYREVYNTEDSGYFEIPANPPAVSQPAPQPFGNTGQASPQPSGNTGQASPQPSGNTDQPAPQPSGDSGYEAPQPSGDSGYDDGGSGYDG